MSVDVHITDKESALPAPPVSGWRILAVALTFIGFIICGTLIAVALKLVIDGTAIGDISARTLLGTEFVALGTLASQGLGLIGAVYLVGLRAGALPWSTIGLRPIGRAWIWRALGLALLCVMIITPLASGFQSLLGREDPIPQLPALAPEGLTVQALVASFLLGGMVIPIGEELFFRGMIYGWLRSRLPSGGSIIVSAALFGAAHVIVEVMFSAFLMGLVLAAVYERSRSLWVPIIFHIAFNLISLSIIFAALRSGVV